MPTRCLLDNALATMGAGLPSAMMASLLHPQRRVMAVCGDGGFMMNSQELETAVRLKLDLVVMVLNDSAYGMIRWKQAVDGFPDFGMTFGNPDFVRYAESYGAKGSRVAAAEDLVPTLEAAFAAGGVHLVEVADRLFRECPRAGRRTAQPFRREGVDGGGAMRCGAATGTFVAELATSGAGGRGERARRNAAFVPSPV